MAGDWIKMRMDLPEDPAVYKLASLTKLDRLSIVGRLYAFWAWADRHAVDGRVDGASSTVVDDIVRFDGFADALVSTKWLVIGDDFIEIPNHDRHNGESAKERGLKNARQARWRDKKSTSVDVPASTSPSTGASTREEKRREDKDKSADEPRFDARAELSLRGVQQQTATDFIALRKAQKAPLTPTALAQLIAEADKAGMALERVLTMCCIKGWRGFKAAWVKDELSDSKPAKKDWE
jgi:hypothetical protein